jgi:hypothetical protein
VIYEDDASAVVKLSNQIINLLQVSNAPTLVEPIAVAAPGGSRCPIVERCSRTGRR